jgi:uncharacterized damage-inducible protein DinB
MTVEAAKTISDYLMAHYEQEHATTLRVLERVPAGKQDYAPDQRSMNALKLAWHIASADWFFMDCIANGEFKAGEPGVPESIKSPADVVAWYKTNVPAAAERVKAMTGEQLAKELDFFGMMKAPGVDFVALMLKHSIHHRGQLSAYLRPMGAKVPGIYGPSGDTE